MKKYFGVFLAVIIASFLFSCAPKLSPDEARNIIEQHYGYPIPRYISLRWDSTEHNLQEVFNSLFKEGYINPNPNRYDAWWDTSYYDPSEKGKPYINSSVRLNKHDNNLRFDCGCSVEVIKEIREVLIDKKNNIATVEYIVAWRPNEPIFSLVCKKNSFYVQNNTQYLNNTEMKKVKLQKYDKGWRVEED